MGATALVNEDWHATCQAIYKGAQGAEWENLRCTFAGDEQESQLPSSNWKQKGQDAVEDKRR